MAVTPWSECTARKHDGSFCESQSLPEAPIPICLEHAAQVYRFINDRAEDALNAASDNPAMQVISVLADALTCGRDRQAIALEKSVIYYLRVGELIKIGRTVNLKSRMNNYPPGTEILATEPGGLMLEAARLDQFAQHLRHRREWFAPEPALLTHINALRKANRDKPISV